MSYEDTKQSRRGEILWSKHQGFREGVVVFVGFADLANFWFGFSVFRHLKTAVYRFWCLARIAGFLQFSLRFLVFAVVALKL